MCIDATFFAFICCCCCSMQLLLCRCLQGVIAPRRIQCFPSHLKSFTLLLLFYHFVRFQHFSCITYQYMMALLECQYKYQFYFLNCADFLPPLSFLFDTCNKMLLLSLPYYRFIYLLFFSQKFRSLFFFVFLVFFNILMILYCFTASLSIFFLYSKQEKRGISKERSCWNSDDGADDDKSTADALFAPFETLFSEMEDLM